MPVQVCIGFGSNLGERENLLIEGRRRLCETPGVSLKAASHIYETEPIGPAGQGPYLNAVVVIESDLSAGRILRRLLQIERESGRSRQEEALRWGPRLLDLDLLLYGDQRIREPGLEVPHPRLHEREFVLLPLCEVLPDALHPERQERLDALLARFTGTSSARVWRSSGPDSWEILPRP